MPALMPVPVVQIGIVRVLVAHRLVAVPMGMRLGIWPIMRVLMMVVVVVGVVVFQRLVHVIVIMPFRQMQPQPDGHQNPCADQLQRHRIPKQRQRQNSANERGE